MEFEILGGPDDGVTLELDYREFAYAGKFVMSDTGKTVARADGETVGAVAFSPDRSDAGVVRLRYVTVCEDRRGDGIGARLLRFTADRLSRQFRAVRIAVNNPIAYRSCYRAGFQSTGTERGIAELDLRYEPAGQRDEHRYQEGLAVFATRDLPTDQQHCLERSRRTGPPAVVAVP
ncbi:MAG: GNAT family N-acetyltransferase [Halovenus sp.]